MAKKLKKSEKRLLIALGVVAVVSAIMLYRIYGPQPAPEEVEQTTPTTSTAETPTATPSRGGSRGGGGGSRGGGSRGGGSSASTDITNIAQHNKPNDCWVTIDGDPYDITGFIQEYQSNDETISGFCGTYGFEVGFLGENPELRDFVLANAIKK